ncbi:hypothetical protein [uncultured Roseobacter sp.]|uniref:hypothetical protein n=1 Tax=uncultured Roseobacter sp. TaxID=114847 RepID=UPI0026278769|nr:hypothetical protein [uncultured Roseobacter sp.]
MFGNPVEPLRDRRGRPSFAKTKENQDFVAVRAAAGWSQKLIAEALGCDEKTLRLHFYRELHGGALIVEGMCLDVWMQKARQGHGPSIKALKEMVGDNAPAAPVSKTPAKDGATDEPEEVEAPLGKKEQAIQAAQDVPDDWGDIRQRRKH